jgi:hypothetical protein
MKRTSTVVIAGMLLVASVIGGVLIVAGGRSVANECSRGSLRGNIISQGSRAELSLNRRSYRCIPRSVSRSVSPSQPFYTYELLCEANSQPGPGTLCSVAPCLQANKSFALRNLQFPDGRTEPAGYGCLNPEMSNLSPGITISQVYAAIRDVKLPGGKISAAPSVRGLANLESFFWLEGVAQPPVDLSIAGSVLHAEFRVAEYRWTFGGGESLVTTGAGTPGLDSEVRTRFRRRGVYPVGVTVMWVAEAWLDGRRVGEVDDLVSRAETTYPVAELRTVLTG